MSHQSRNHRITAIAQARPVQRVPRQMLFTGLIIVLLLALSAIAFVGQANAQDPAQPVVQDSPVDDSTAEATTSALPENLERISWGAILAGTAVALVVQLALNLLGLALGASTIDPVDHSTPEAKTLGMGAVAWMGISSLISLFLGGWVAGRLAGMPDNTDAMLHGLITWALVTLVSTFFVTTSLGAFVSGATAMLARGLNAAGKGMAAVGTGAAAAAGTAATAAASAAGAASDAAGSAANAAQRQGITVQSIENDIKNLMQRMGVDVQGVQAQASDAMQQVKGQATDSAQQMQSSAQQEAQRAGQNIVNNPSMATAQQEIANAARRLMSQQGITDADRQEVMNSLTSYARMTQQEAQQTVRRWENAVENAKREAEQTAREAATQAARAVAALSGAVFAALVIGAFAAGLGGIVGAPEELPVVEIDAAGS